MPSARHLRLGIGTLDQLTSSLSNVAVVFAMARVSDVSTFGSISLVLAAMSMTLAISRGMLGTIVSLFSHNPEELQREASFAITVALCGGIVAGCVMVALAANTLVGATTAVLALSLPFVLAQDVGRFFAMAKGRPGVALTSDVIWTIGGLLMLAWTWVSPDVTLQQIAAVWSVMGVIAFASLIPPLRLRPGVRGLRGWLISTKWERIRFGGEAAIGAGTSFLVLTGSALVLSTTAAAALRGAGSIMGPLSLLMSAITLAVIPELRRSGPDVSAIVAWSHLRKVSLLLSTLALVVGVAAWVLPASLGALLLGDSWSVARGIVPIAAVEYAALSWLSGCAAGLRAQGRSRSLLELRLVFSLLTLGLAGLGAWVVDAVWGVSAGLALAAIIGAALGRRTLLGGAVT